MDNTNGIMPVMPIGGSNEGGGFMWIFGLLVLLGLFNGNFGGPGNNRAALGYENLATSAEVQRGFDAQAAQGQSREILSAVTGSAYQTVGAIKDGNALLVREIGGVGNMLMEMAGKQQECCCQTLRAIDGVNYAGALNTAAINENVTAQTQKILDAITGNRIADMQNQINQLTLAQQLCGVVRYPVSTAYTAGVNPFFAGCCPSI